MNSELTSIPTYPVTLSKDDWGLESPKRNAKVIYIGFMKPLLSFGEAGSLGHDDFPFGTPFCLFSYC